MLQVSNLSVYYGSFRALDDINIEAAEGELIVLLGANGAGKT
jgi:branched-chain amino acid transport system ATP-binding protein